MPRPTTKRKMSKEGSGDETLPAVQKKAQSRRNTVKFADPETGMVREPIRTRSSLNIKFPKSILNTKPTPLSTTPESPETASSPSSVRPKEAKTNTEEGESIAALAVIVMKKSKDAHTERLHTGLSTSHKDFIPLGTDRGNEQIYQKALWETRELVDTRKRAENVTADLKEALLANERSENRVKTLETQLKRSEERVENLQRELAAIKEVKAEMEKLLGEKTAEKNAGGGQRRRRVVIEDEKLPYVEKLP